MVLPLPAEAALSGLRARHATTDHDALGEHVINGPVVVQLPGAHRRSGGYLTGPVNPAVPICAEDPAYAEDWGNDSCPFSPLKTNLPR